MKSTSKSFLQSGSARGIGIVLVAIVLVAGLGYIFVTSKGSQNIANPVVATADTTGQTTTSGTTVTTPTTVPTQPAPSVSAVTPTQTPTSVQTSVYKDGTYSAVGTYRAPGGQESIDITVTLKNDIIVATSAVSGSNDGTSRRYQNMFISGYKALVIGKKINTISLDTVSGSSLTPQGFDNALTQIEAQAKA